MVAYDKATAKRGDRLVIDRRKSKPQSANVNAIARGLAYSANDDRPALPGGNKTGVSGLADRTNRAINRIMSENRARPRKPKPRQTKGSERG